jgi:hypothetical protein
VTNVAAPSSSGKGVSSSSNRCTALRIPKTQTQIRKGWCLSVPFVRML